MNIYLAGRYVRGPELDRIAARLRSLGHEVTSRWLDRATGRRAEVPMADAAQEDERDLSRSDLAVFLMETPDSGYQSGGRHVEFGLARAWGKTAAIVGAPENVFHYLADYVAEDWDDLIDWIGPAVPPTTYEHVPAHAVRTPLG